jgi:hypothetical protein
VVAHDHQAQRQQRSLQRRHVQQLRNGPLASSSLANDSARNLDLANPDDGDLSRRQGPSLVHRSQQVTAALNRGHCFNGKNREDRGQAVGRSLQIDEGCVRNIETDPSITTKVHEWVTMPSCLLLRLDDWASVRVYALERPRRSRVKLIGSRVQISCYDFL